MSITLDYEKVLEIHRKLITLYGGSHGIRDMNLLQSALGKGDATFFGKDLYSDIYSKISAITFAIINNHPMVDGNKWLGIAVMLIFLKLNDKSISYTQEELINLGLSIAKSECKEDCIKTWILNHKVC